MNRKSMLFTSLVATTLSTATLVYAEDAPKEVTPSTPESSLVATESSVDSLETTSSNTSVSFEDSRAESSVSAFSTSDLVKQELKEISHSETDWVYTYGDYTIYRKSVYTGGPGVTHETFTVVASNGDIVAVREMAGENPFNMEAWLEDLVAKYKAGEITPVGKEESTSSSNVQASSEVGLSNATVSTGVSVKRELKEVSHSETDWVYTYGDYTIYRKSVYTGGPGVTHETFTVVASNGDIVAVHEMAGENPFNMEAWLESIITKYEAGEIASVGKMEGSLETNFVLEQSSQATSTKKEDKGSLPKTGTEVSSVVTSLVGILIAVFSFVTLKKNTQK